MDAGLLPLSFACVSEVMLRLMKIAVIVRRDLIGNVCMIVLHLCARCVYSASIKLRDLLFECARRSRRFFVHVGVVRRQSFVRRGLRAAAKGPGVLYLDGLVTNRHIRARRAAELEQHGRACESSELQFALESEPEWNEAQL
jgi:hypothetical protein